jgi:YD repeat-containing protein
MKTIYIYLWALLLGSIPTTVYSQSEEEINENKAFLPNSTPPAPEAFAMTKYGDVPVDEFNGKVDLNVPIFEYKAGMLTIPISADYYGAGVKISDIPTQVGINWTLNAGGLISREIKGQPDEVLDKLSLTLNQIVALNQADCSTEAEQLRAIIDNKNLDKENDIFNFKFLGYSGSFFLNDNFDPVLTKNDQELRIEIYGAQPNKSQRLREGKTFLITTPDGIKFYFGGESASEDSAMRIITNGTVDIFSVGGITSFYLYKIEHPVNGTILLDYHTSSLRKVPTNTNYFKVRKTVDDFAVSHALNTWYNCPGLPISNVSYSSGYTLTEHWISNEKMIQKIYSPDTGDYILFTRDEYPTAMNFKRVLKRIEYFKGGVVFKKVDFEYSGLAPLNLHRFFLTKIDFNNHITGMDNKRESYVFEYNAPSDLPTLNSTSIDVLGYFNNKSNIDLYPRFPDESQNTAPDRTSNFIYASKGVLKKVIYPTKGYSTFEYESQPYIEPEYKEYSLDVYYNGTGALDGEGVFVNGAYQKLHDEIPGVNIDENNVQSPHLLDPIVYTQTVRVMLDVSNPIGEEEEEFPDPNQKPFKAKVIITEMNQQGTVLSVTEKITGQATSFMYKFNAGSQYKITMDLITPTTLSPEYHSRGVVTFTLKKGFHAPTGYGVRLKKTSNYDLNTQKTFVKTYYYNPYHRIGELLTDDSFHYSQPQTYGGYLVVCGRTSQTGTGNTVGGVSVPLMVNSSTLNSNMNFLDNTLLGSFREYNCVTVGYGDGIAQNFNETFKNGGIEKTFSLNAPIQGFRIAPYSANNYIEDFVLDFSEKLPYSNPNPMNGQLIKEKIFSYTNGVQKIKEITYGYSNDISYQKYNLTGRKLLKDISVTCDMPGGSNGRVLSNYWIDYYYTNSFAFKRTAQKETNYIDPVPATLVAHVPTEFEDPSLFPTQEVLEASYKKITTTQDYEYGTLRGLPTKVSTTMSDGTTQKSESVYVNQYGTLTGLTTDQTAAYALMLAQNNIASPIEVKQSDNSETLTKKRTTYKIVSGTKVVPQKIYTAKGTQPIEDRATFEEYDSKGNPTLMSLTGGVKIKYLYNANNQVIAKIENFTGTLDPNTNSIANAITFIGQYPNAQVSVFEYEPITNLLVRMYDPNGKKTTYEYDDLHRLKQIKDNENNVIKAFDQNFKH